MSYFIVFTCLISIEHVGKTATSDWYVSPDWKGPGWYRIGGQAGTRMPEVNFMERSYSMLLAWRSVYNI